MSVDEFACPVCGRVFRSEGDARGCHGIPSPRVARYVIAAMGAATVLILVLLAVVG